jgi:hypothetical protein
MDETTLEDVQRQYAAILERLATLEILLAGFMRGVAGRLDTLEAMTRPRHD